MNLRKYKLSGPPEILRLFFGLSVILRQVDVWAVKIVKKEIFEGKI